MNLKRGLLMLEYTATFTVPQWAVSYMEYGDGADLTPDEIAQIERFEEQLAAYGPHTWEWGSDIGFCTNNDIGGLACNCIQLHLFVDVPRMAGDPTRGEMVKSLVKAFRAPRWDRADWKFDLEAAIYWFSSHWHGGQWSNLYSALSTSPYRPGALCNGLEIGSQAHDMYIYLTERFCPKFDQGGAK